MRYYNSVGKLKYSSNGWLIIEVSQSICEYYKWWVQRLTWRKVSTPYYGAHITCVAGLYTPGIAKHPKWYKYQGKSIFFQYSNEITFQKQKDGTYYWLPVICNEVGIIRTELGLPPNLRHPLHLTIAYYQHSS